MSDPHKDTIPSPPGGHAAERLREFLRERLPAGASPNELNPALEKTKSDKDRGPEENQQTQKDNADPDAESSGD